MLILDWLPSSLDYLFRLAVEMRTLGLPWNPIADWPIG